MFIGIKDMVKIGIGPSSSHTMGPMSAASRFIENLTVYAASGANIDHIQARIHGSLAFTGKGHATDRAIFLGLMGFVPASLDPAKVAEYEAALMAEKQINHEGLGIIRFDPETDLIFDYDVTIIVK